MQQLDLVDVFLQSLIREFLLLCYDDDFLFRFWQFYSRSFGATALSNEEGNDGELLYFKFYKEIVVLVVLMLFMLWPTTTQ